MKKVISVVLCMVILLGATNFNHPKNKKSKSEEKKEYQISTCAYQDRTGTIWVFETLIDKNTGKLEYRKQVHSKKYKNVK